MWRVVRRTTRERGDIARANLSLVNETHAEECEQKEKLCQNAKRDFEFQDTLTVQESNETKVNVFMNAKYNLHSCYDLELLKRQLISNGVSPEKLKFLELKAVENDGDLIEFTMPAT